MANPTAGRSLVSGIKRNFSNLPSGNAGVNNTPAMVMGALGLGGLAYVSYMSSEMSGG